MKIPGPTIVGPGIQRTAAAYSPTWWGSTIGDGGLNFSVRNGKRWILTAITTAVYYLREKVLEAPSGSLLDSYFIALGDSQSAYLSSRESLSGY